MDLNVVSCEMAAENEEENVFNCWLIFFFCCGGCLVLKDTYRMKVVW